MLEEFAERGRSGVTAHGRSETSDAKLGSGSYQPNESFRLSCHRQPGGGLSSAVGALFYQVARRILVEAAI